MKELRPARMQSKIIRAQDGTLVANTNIAENTTFDRKKEGDTGWQYQRRGQVYYTKPANGGNWRAITEKGLGRDNYLLAMKRLNAMKLPDTDAPATQPDTATQASTQLKLTGGLNTPQVDEASRKKAADAAESARTASQSRQQVSSQVPASKIAESTQELLNMAGLGFAPTASTTGSAGKPSPRSTYELAEKPLGSPVDFGPTAQRAKEVTFTASKLEPLSESSKVPILDVSEIKTLGTNPPSTISSINNKPQRPTIDFGPLAVAAFNLLNTQDFKQSPLPMKSLVAMPAKGMTTAEAGKARRNLRMQIPEGRKSTSEAINMLREQGRRSAEVDLESNIAATDAQMLRQSEQIQNQILNKDVMNKLQTMQMNTQAMNQAEAQKAQAKVTSRAAAAQALQIGAKEKADRNTALRSALLYGDRLKLEESFKKASNELKQALQGVTPGSEEYYEVLEAYRQKIEPTLADWGNQVQALFKDGGKLNLSSLIRKYKKG